jgi:RimJ/RimL family protein N-acetyltransferase
MKTPLTGSRIALRPATMADRKSIYEWLAESDLTLLMLGPPLFPENEVPTWYDFISDYDNHFFTGRKPAEGQCFIIEMHGEAVGQVNYNDIHGHATELDIWMRSSEYTNKGYGSDALETLCEHLKLSMGLTHFYIAPAAKNKAALAAYKKAGFNRTEEKPEWFKAGYKNAVLMVKQL